MHRKFISQAALIVVLHIATGAAFAQFAWIDAKGVRQYSDQPPPASVPKNRIIKSPAFTLRESAAAAASEGSGGDKAGDKAAAKGGDKSGEKPAGTKTAMTTAEKNADFIKRQSEQAEKEKKAADDAKNAAIKARNCENAQSYARSLESGARITSMDKNGERTFMSDEKRAKEIGESRRLLEGCK